MHRVIIPLESNLYGRNISASAPPHRFLPGAKGGCMPGSTVHQYPEVILVEGLFDYATVWQAGFHWQRHACAMGKSTQRAPASTTK